MNPEPNESFRAWKGRREVEFLTVEEVAKLMHVRVGRAYAMLQAGMAPSVKIGGRRHVPRAAWDAWCADQTAKAMASLRTEKVKVPHGR
jgi:excisionase family DNA binding protein